MVSQSMEGCKVRGDKKGDNVKLTFSGNMILYDAMWDYTGYYIIKVVDPAVCVSSISLDANSLSLKKGETKQYAAKVFKKENSNSIDIEIKILKELKQYNNKYIINIIEDGNEEIVRNNRKKKILKYFIMENAPNGNIFDYIYCRKSGLGELYSKIIFQKIFQS